MATTAAPATRVDEIAAGVHRISTALPPEVVPGGFTFNQFLIAGPQPLLFHTGPRMLFPAVRAAVASVLPVDSLRWIAFSHFEADECGALNQFLEAAPAATALCSGVGAMTSIGDYAVRPPRALADGEELDLGDRRVAWMDTPHMPHGWDCGLLHDLSTGTLFCGDLFTQGGHEHDPLTEADILAPALAAHGMFDYFAHSRGAGAQFEKLIARKPQLLACMHGASWRGDGAALLGDLARALGS